MKKYLIAFIIFFTIQLSLSAQTRQVPGKVTDDAGAPLTGVSVLVKGSKNGVQTNTDGNFIISTQNAGKIVLVFTHTGYKVVSVTTDGTMPVSVKMEKDVSALEDVVVIGYQTVKRKNLLASVSSVGARDLKDIPVNSAAEALNGRLAGVTATTAEGSPDAQIRIRVRGGMSITGDNSPLFIVDGVQLENALSTISPQDIQTIDVLKDAAATAIYGARGANGVFVITTKSGKQGRLVVSYNGFVGIKKLPRTLSVLNPYDYVFYQSERSRGSSTDSSTFTKNFGSTWDTLQNYKNVDPVNWQDEVFGRTGITQTHNVTASGGSKKLTYNFGYTYNDDKAIVINSNYKRHLLNAKADYNVTSKIKVGLITRYTHQDVYGAGVSDDKGSSYNRLRNAVKYRPFLSANQDIDESDPLADANTGNGLNLVNPILLANSEYRKKTTNVFNITANASINITKNLSFRSVFGYTENTITDRQFSDTLTPYSIIQGGKKPVAGLDTTTTKTITNSNTFTYSIKGFKGKHDIDLLAGEETYDLRTESHSSLFKGYPVFTSAQDAFSKTNLATPFTGYPKFGKTRYTSLSFFGRINYSFLSKYLFSFNIRADGASKFAPGKQWGYFPAGSFAWRVKNEKFLQNVSFITDLKLRAGFGIVGNNRIDDYLFLTTFKNDGSYFYGLNNQAVLAYYSSGLVNENLKWESTVNRNYGIDISLFNRLDLSVDYYDNTSKDLLLNVPIASTYGYASQLQNIGKTSNKGVEVQLGTTILRKKNNLSWTASFNISFNKNKILALGVNQQSFFPAASWGVSGQPTDYIERIGDPVGSMWGLVSDGFYKVEDFNYNNGIYTLKPGMVSDTSIIGTVQPGSARFKDLNNDGKVDVNNDRKIIGNPTPKFTGGLNQQFTYKQWDLSVFVNFSYGNDVYNANKIEFTNGYTANSNMLSIMQNRWKVVTATGQTAQWVNSSNQVVGIAPDQLAALNANATIWQPLKSAGAFYPGSWAIEDGSFLRINNITFGYSLPQKTISRLRMSKLRFYITASNLAVLTSYTGYDPEVSVRSSPLTPGLDYSAYPKSRSFIFGLNASF
ncbi:MAG: TonB-dependent receptor [Chitinophagaceae bacterium]